MGKRSERNISSLAFPNSVINSVKKYKNRILRINGLVARLNPKNEMRSVGLLGFMILTSEYSYSSIVWASGVCNVKLYYFFKSEPNLGSILLPVYSTLIQIQPELTTMKQTIFQVDAFTDRPFKGNPAAVCVLTSSQEDEWMQSVAQEMNLSETAFLLKQDRSYSLRWFTPTTEVPLCGHATLASAHVLWTEGYASTGQAIQFETKSGTLTAKYQDDWIELDFPVSRSLDIPPITKLGDALGAPLKTVLYNSLGYLVEVVTPELVEQLQPNITLLKQLPLANVIVTSRGRSDSEYDFVSRFFAPGLGIDEDPVTGAAHCCLASYWRDRLQQDRFLAYQASARGGTVKIDYDGGERVRLQGQAITVMRGDLL